MKKKIIGKRWFQHIVHDVRHVALLVPLFRFIQGKRQTWHCGAHTLVNSQETCFVSGLAAATQIGADYPFDDPAARRIIQLLREYHVWLGVQESEGLKTTSLLSQRGEGHETGHRRPS